jgi:glycosyltransferase involved in cell wall biosynthesis
MKNHICMIAYTNYSTDARVRREAETVAALPDYDVSVITLKEGELPETHMIRGVTVHEVNLAKYQGKSSTRYIMSYLKFVSLAFLRCNKLLLHRSLDIVHVHNMPDFLLFSAIVPFLFGKKLILDIHDTVIETYLTKFNGFMSGITYWLLRFEEWLCCAIADKIICVNHVQRDALIKRGIPEEKITISMNIPDPRWCSQKSNGSYERQNDSKFTLVYHGTLAKRLGIDLTIEAVARLSARIAGLEYYIVGSGDDAEEFLDLSRRLGVDDKVHFMNSVPIDDLVKTLDGMDLGVIANRANVATELMLPVKMLEYIALDIPVIAPRLKTIEYYFTDYMLGYFEPNNVESLADAIWKAYSNDDLRIKRASNARDFFVEYGWENHKLGLINLYDSLVRN